MATRFDQLAPSQGVTTGRLPALGTAGIAANDVVTVQGIAGGTGFGTVDVSAQASLAALNQAATLSGLNGKAAGLVQLSGTWVGSIQLEGSNDGFTTVTTLSTTQSFGAAPSTTALTANGDYRVLGIINYASIRARCSAFTSGPIVVNLKASDAGGIQPVISTNPLGFLCTAYLGASSASIGSVTFGAGLPAGTNSIGTVAFAKTTQAETALTEQMALMVASQYATVALLAQLVALSRGRTDPPLGEEGDDIINSYLDNRNRLN